MAVKKKTSAKGEKTAVAKKPVKPSHYPAYKRTGARRTAPARATSSFAAQCFPNPMPSRMEQRGFLALKPRVGRTPLPDRLEQCLEWLRSKYRIVFAPREDIQDADDMECLGVTQAAISDFTVDAWIYSIAASVQEMPYFSYPFIFSRALDEFVEGPKKERCKEAYEGIKDYFYGIKREMKKRVENDAYFLNSQFRSHTIWFLEKFFATEIVPPEATDERKIEFEVLLPPPLPKEVADAVSD